MNKSSLQSLPVVTHQSEERMKEKSKAAAKQRRSNENKEFKELGNLLPMLPAVANQLDKASVIRLTNCFLKMRVVLKQDEQLQFYRPQYPYPGLQLPVPPDLQISSVGGYDSLCMGSNLADSTHGFLFVLQQCGKITYVSETVALHLGISQEDMMGNSMYDYIEKMDKEDLEKALTPPLTPNLQFNVSPLSREYSENREFTIRIKCNLQKRDAGLISSGYKVFHCRGYNTNRFYSYQQSDGQMANYYSNIGLLGVACSYPAYPTTEVRLWGNMFMFRATQDFKISYVDPSVGMLLGYDPNEIIEKSFYDFVHPRDTFDLGLSHASLLKKGQARSVEYRFTTKPGGYVWMQSFFTTVTSSRASRQNCVVSVNHIIGNVQHPNEIVSTSQQQINEEKSEPTATASPISRPSTNRKRKLKAAKSKTPPSETPYSSDFSLFKRDKQDVSMTSQRLEYPHDTMGSSDSTVPSVGPYSRSHTFLQNFNSVAEQDNRDALLGLRYRNQPQLFQSYIKSNWGHQHYPMTSSYPHYNHGSSGIYPYDVGGSKSGAAMSTNDKPFHDPFYGRSDIATTSQDDGSGIGSNPYYPNRHSNGAQGHGGHFYHAKMAVGYLPSQQMTPASHCYGHHHSGYHGYHFPPPPTHHHGAAHHHYFSARKDFGFVPWL